MKIAAWCALSLLLPAGSAAPQEPLSIIDTHAHLDQPQQPGRGSPMDRMQRNAQGTANFGIGPALEDMDRNGYGVSILMPPPQSGRNAGAYDLESLQQAVRAHAGRFVLLGGGGTLNPMLQDTPAGEVTDAVRQRFRQRAEAILAGGAVGFGEMTARHLSLTQMGPQHPFEEVPPDHPLLLLLADIAAERGVPIDLHLDLTPHDMPLPARPHLGAANPSQLAENLAAFERLLAHNPQARIVWAHAGTDPLFTRNVQVQRGLLRRHPNLYMSLRVSRSGPHPSFAMDGGQRLKPEWLALIREFPDRFMIGTDRFHPPAGAGLRTPDDSLARARALVDQLPPELARAVAFENAQRVYGLPR